MSTLQSRSPSRLRPRVSTSISHSLRTGSSSPDPPPSSVSYLPPIESLIIPGGPVDEDTAELLREFVHPYHHDTEDTAIVNPPEDHDVDPEHIARARLPWWKRPAPWWLMTVLPFAAIASSSTIAPRVEVYTILACKVYKPEYTSANPVAMGPVLPYTTGHFNPSVQPITVFPGTFGGATKHCASDPEVQAAVAELAAVMSATMGVISCITTAWWGSLSDRSGRTRIMGISMLGSLFTDVNLVLVAHFSEMLPGGYWFLILGPIIEGLVAGMTAGVAAMHAYLSDTTDPSSRSHAFSLFLGVLFIGVAIGPTIGSLIIRLTANVLSVFYFATLMHAIYFMLVWFIIPESLSRNQMAASRARHQEKLATLREEREGAIVGILVRIKRLFRFLSPLAILLPTPVEGGNPLKRRKRDWNLTLIVIAYGFTIMIMGSLSYKLQYAASTFNWSAETMGYYISFIGAVRAVHLVVVLPLIIKLLKPKHLPIQLPPDPDYGRPPHTKEHYSPSFDLNIARVSVIIDIISFVGMGLSQTSVVFTLFTMLGSFGVGFSPGAHSVALELYVRRGEKDNGKLFGAMSVVQALCSQIIGPALFGFVYIRTVRLFPPAVFFVSSIAVFGTLILLSLVRLSSEGREDVIAVVEDQAPGNPLHSTRAEDMLVLEPELDDTAADGPPKFKDGLTATSPRDTLLDI